MLWCSAIVVYWIAVWITVAVIPSASPSFFIWCVIFVVWNSFEVVPQVNYLGKTFGSSSYVKKPWGTPIGIAIGAVACVVIPLATVLALTQRDVNDMGRSNKKLDDGFARHTRDALNALDSRPTGDMRAIQLVKKGHLESHPATPLGPAIDNFLEKPRWDSGRSKAGQQFVNVSGNISYSGKRITAMLQFFVNVDSDKFELNAIELNGVPMDILTKAALMDKILAAYRE